MESSVPIKYFVCAMLSGPRLLYLVVAQTYTHTRSLSFPFSLFTWMSSNHSGFC